MCGSTVIVWSYENTFLCKEKKNNYFIQQFLLFMSVDAHVYAARMHMHALSYCHEHTSKTDTEEKKLLNKVVIFVAQKVSS